ncbi:MAG: hypothetical protein AAF697_11400 [Pseudomonadota bacterium]
MIFGIPLFAIWTAHRHKIAKLELESAAEGTAEKAAQYASDITKLEDRVAVLERIVTDRGYDVATQIEALRDTRSVEDSGSGIPLDIGKKESA